jgi:hypothetical protein
MGKSIHYRFYIREYSSHIWFKLNGRKIKHKEQYFGKENIFIQSSMPLLILIVLAVPTILSITSTSTIPFQPKPENIENKNNKELQISGLLLAIILMMFIFAVFFLHLLLINIYLHIQHYNTKKKIQ